MQTQGQIENVVDYATNTLAIMVPASNPKHVASLNDLGRTDVRLSMSNPAWEGIAKQIAETLRKAGGNDLYQAVYQKKVKDGTSELTLTEIHHRQTPMRILDGKADAGVVWEVPGTDRQSHHWSTDSGDAEHDCDLCRGHA